MTPTASTGSTASSLDDQASMTRVQFGGHVLGAGRALTTILEQAAANTGVRLRLVVHASWVGGYVDGFVAGSRVAVAAFVSQVTALLHGMVRRFTRLRFLPDPAHLT